MNNAFGNLIVWSTNGSWRQDEGQFGYTRTGVGQSLQEYQSVILDTTPTTITPYFKGLISTNRSWYGEERATLQRDGGNIDVSPPDAQNPYGRLIVGDDLPISGVDFLEKQKIQGPIIKIDTQWLLVGHMDEMISIVPSGSSYVALVADLTNAIGILNDYATYPTNDILPAYDGLSRSNLLAIYNSTSNAGAISQIQGYLDAASSNLSTQLGCSIIRIPVAFDLNVETGACQSYLPNSVNAAVAKLEEGTVKVGFPDPHFQPFKTVIQNRVSGLPISGAWIWCFELNPYQGNAHCASNVDKEFPAE